VLRLGGQHPKERGRQALREPVHAPEALEQLERGQRSARRGAHQATAHARARPEGVRGRRPREAGTYSYEQRYEVTLSLELERRFRARKKAWAWFQDQSSAYRSNAMYWVMSAKKQETRERRLATLIEDSAAGQRVPPLRRPTPS
jgi:Bacteriocin-protection, YdeI or OmpD-Associated